MGQAILAQHGFQGVDLGGNVHAHILQKGVVQFGVGPIQRMQDGGDVAADFGSIRCLAVPQPLGGIQQLASGGQVLFPEAAHPWQLLGVIMHEAQNRRAGLLHFCNLFVGLAA